MTMRVKGAPPAARYVVVSNPGTIFERIEDYCGSMHTARECATCYDDPVDIMRILPNGDLTTEF